MFYPTGLTLRRVNSLVKHAMATSPRNETHFRHVGGETVHSIQMTDSGHSTQRSSYQCEERLVLCKDLPHARHAEPEDTGKSYYGLLCAGGASCLLFVFFQECAACEPFYLPIGDDPRGLLQRSQHPAR